MQEACIDLLAARPAERARGETAKTRAVEDRRARRPAGRHSPGGNRGQPVE